MTGILCGLLLERIPLHEKTYCVYIMASHTRTLYTGVTNKIIKRVYEHKKKQKAGFTRKYNFVNLVYYEVLSDVRAAIDREREIKGWRRAKKVSLIESKNPEWKDLSEGWFKGAAQFERLELRSRRLSS